MIIKGYSIQIPYSYHHTINAPRWVILLEEDKRNVNGIYFQKKGIFYVDFFELMILPWLSPVSV